MTSLFGRLIGGHHVEDATVSVLRYWLPTYLHEVERQSGEVPGEVATPRAYRISSEVEKMPEDQTPAIIVRSPGVADSPLKTGHGNYQAQFQIEVAAVVSARSAMEQGGEPRALRIARLYALAMRACLVQQPDVNGILFRRDWTDESYEILPSIDDRTICAAKAMFHIEVPDVTDANSGPIEPLVPPDDPTVAPPVPSPEWPTAIEADVLITKVPIGEDVTP